MLVRVLGSAAGGGFPQWNCACTNCNAVRGGAPELEARTQDSVAVSADGCRWLLLNASPDLRAQFEAFPALWPRAKRDTPLAAVALTNGDLDHVLGLFSLRESQPLQILATSAVRRGLCEQNAFMSTLQRFQGHSRWIDLELGRSIEINDASGEPIGLSVEAAAAPGKLPLHLVGKMQPSELDNIGLLVREARQGAALAYFPGVAAASEALVGALARAQACLFDGTFWSSGELIEQGLAAARAEDMAHWPLSGRSGSMSWLVEHAPRRCLISHVNNTNPILRRGSAERLALERLGLELARDGRDLEL